jgi:uncharacterized membrane protein YccF (DUF307 family)
MSLIALLLNLLWIVFGGGWVIAAVVMAITIIGLPWARAAFNIASYTQKTPCPVAMFLPILGASHVLPIAIFWEASKS